MDNEKLTQEVTEEIDKIATLTNKEYFDQMDKARRKIAKQKASEWANANPYKEEIYGTPEEYAKKVIAVGKDILESMPNYLEQELRTVVEWNQSIFTLGLNILNEITDFKNVYIAVNEAKVKAYARNHVNINKEN